MEMKCEDLEQHQKEGDEQEKGRQEVINDIRKQFKKEELGGKKRMVEDSKDSVRFGEGDFTVESAKPRPNPAAVAAPVSGAANAEDKKNIDVKSELLLHGASCKACLRMNTLVGEILPHSPNY